jgi:hypothetical protein
VAGAREALKQRGGPARERHDHDALPKEEPTGDDQGRDRSPIPCAARDPRSRFFRSLTDLHFCCASVR